jgi:Holliday junction resolvase-like predicted endonuclease
VRRFFGEENGGAAELACGGEGEIAMIGYDWGRRWLFVEVRPRIARGEMTPLPELGVTQEKQELVARMAKMLLVERQVKECPCRFDVLAIASEAGRAPLVRLHKRRLASRYDGTKTLVCRRFSCNAKEIQSKAIWRTFRPARTNYKIDLLRVSCP